MEFEENLDLSEIKKKIKSLGSLPNQLTVACRVLRMSEPEGENKKKLNLRADLDFESSDTDSESKDRVKQQFDDYLLSDDSSSFGEESDVEYETLKKPQLYDETRDSSDSESSHEKEN